MRDWAVSLSGIAGGLQPGQEMCNYFSIEIERGRTSRPPYSPYVTTDSLASTPWMPPDEPHAKALERWVAIHVTSHRHTGGQGLSLAQFALYRMRFFLAGDLAGAWSHYNRLERAYNASTRTNDPSNFRTQNMITWRTLTDRI